MVLKIAVLSSGAVLADGQPVELNQLDEMLQKLKAEGGTVWYYREQTANPEDVGMSVIRLVVKHKLSIRLSTKPDYSDEVDPKSASRAQANAPRMPDVVQREDIEQVFATARRTAAGNKAGRGLVVVAPDRRMLLMPALEVTDKLNEMAAGMERLIPSAVKRKIAVIGYTDIPAATPGSFNVAEANRAIPFLGLLTGLTYIGHSVWIFEGHPSALAAGCREADVLFVDSGMLPHLVKGWEETASGAMRNANILVHDRSTLKLRFVRRAGESRDRLEFPH
jgi:hypothetical protein